LTLHVGHILEHHLGLMLGLHLGLILSLYLDVFLNFTSALITSRHLSSSQLLSSSPRAPQLNQLVHVLSNTQPKFAETAGVVHRKRHKSWLRLTIWATQASLA